VPFNDLDAAAAEIDGTTSAVIVEPVQGEGGVNPARESFLKGLRSLCDRHGAVLIFDEVQCGLGRTGTLWAHQQYDVTPDIMTLAKPLAGGLPIGATLVTEEIARAIEPGDHGSTFAAGPLVCRAAQVVFDRANRPAFLKSVRVMGEMLRRGIREINSPLITEVRGRGLLVGVALDVPARPLIDRARSGGLLIINAGDDVLRICPPLTVKAEHIQSALTILARCLREAEAAS
jgi:acetylornithine/succinyldiaminopimelate/putrescine aminotransferase